MIIINRKRGLGKTTALIYMSAATELPIITNNIIHSKAVKREAEKLKLHIPEPLTVHEWHLFQRGRKVNGILIDDLDIMLPYILQDYFGTEIRAVSVTEGNA